MHASNELEKHCGSCLLFGAIEGMADGLILVDLDGKVFHLNRAAHELLKVGSRPIVGTRLQAWLREEGLASFWSRAEEEDVPVTADLNLPGGATIRATATFCLSASREPIGRALLLRDVTSEKRIHVELSASVAERIAAMSGGDEPEMQPGTPPLTAREHQVLGLLSEGLTNSEIALRLNVSVNTIASHLKNIYPKLNVSSRSQATAYAVSRGLRFAHR